MDGDFSGFDIGNPESVSTGNFPVKWESHGTFVGVGSVQVSAVRQGVVRGIDIVLSMEVFVVVSENNDELKLHSFRFALGNKKTMGETTVADLLVNHVVATSGDGIIDFLEKFLESLAVWDGDRGGFTGTTDYVL